MTRRYTREEDTMPAFLYYARIREACGTTACGIVLPVEPQMYSDLQVALMLQRGIARGEVTPVPVDINQEAATFKRAKKR